METYDKEKDDMKTELMLRKFLHKERETSNQSYAAKFVEKLAVAFVAMVLIAVVGAIIGSVVYKPSPPPMVPFLTPE